MTETERLTVLYGDPALAPPVRETLHAGPLTLGYEPTTGDVRYVKWGPHEVLRRVYGAIRDAEWGTVPGVVTELERIIEADRFRIVYESRHRDAERGIDFRWTGTIEGFADGTLAWTFDGEALSDFDRNRIGLCVLHPADLKGRACTVVHSDGTHEPTAFPDLIAPHQPFLDVSVLAHEIAPGATATVTFSGDTFETEDQRNWLDASYKTYSTPLALPFPVRVTQGTHIRQTVTLQISGEFALSPPEEIAGPVVVTVGREELSFLPDLLLTVSTGPLSKSAFRQFGLYHFLSNFGLQAFRYRLSSDVKKATGNAVQPLQTIYGDDVSSLVYMDNVQTLLEDDVYINLPDSVVQAVVSETNFTELNRNRPQTKQNGRRDTVAFAANPQVHAFDSTSIMETPPMVAEAVRTARTFTDGEIHVGPLVLYGPYKADEPRQHALFAAAWTLAAFAYAVTHKVSSVTLCETTGSRGAVTANGEDTPLSHVLGLFSVWAAPPPEPEIGGGTDTSVLQAEVNDITRVAALALRHKGLEYATGDTDLQEILVVNLTPELQRVSLYGLKRDMARLRLLDAANANTGFSERESIDCPEGHFELTLSSYAIACVTCGKYMDGDEDGEGDDEDDEEY